MATENGTVENTAVANPDTGAAPAADPKGKGKAPATAEEHVEDTSMVDDEDDDDEDDDDVPEEVSVSARSSRRRR